VQIAQQTFDDAGAGRASAPEQLEPEHGDHASRIDRTVGLALQVKTFLGGGWGCLVPPVPVTQGGEQKDGRQPG
jgi:hypothetical protein